MNEQLLLKDGLRIGKKELSLLQETASDNLSSVVQAMANVPAVITAVGAGGVLGADLSVSPSGTNIIVAVGSALLADGTVLTVSSPVTLAVSPGLTNSTVILKADTTPYFVGTMSLAADRLTLTASGSDDLTTEFSPNDYIRLQNGASDLGAFRIQTVTTGGVVLAEAVAGSGTISGLQFAPAGKFFPGYPLNGDTKDLCAFATPTLRIDVPGYTPLENEILLALVSRSSSVTVTDARTPLRAKNVLTSIVDADIASGAAIQSTKFSTGVQTALSEAHVQNTDTFTTSQTFLLGGAAGKRVLTTDDLPHTPSGPPVPNPSDTPNWPALAPELNAEVGFATTLSAFSTSKIAGARIVLAQLSWGINGTAGAPSINGSAQTIALSSTNLATSIATNALVGYVLYDAAGRPWAITASTASAGDHSFSVTVTTTDATGATGTAAAGAAIIISSAANYRFEVVPMVGGQPDESQKSVETGTLNTFGYPTDYKQLNYIGVPGSDYVIRIIGVRNGVESTLAINVTWGTVTGAGTVTVPSASISATSTLSTVTFTWPSPAGFVSATMDYRIAVQLDGSPASPPFNLQPQEIPDGSGGAGGSYTVACGPGQLATIFVRVVDLGGNTLSTADGTRSYAAQSAIFSTYQKEVFTFSFTGASFPGTPNIPVTTYARTILGGNYEIGGIEVDFTTFNVAAGTRFKVGVWPSGAQSQEIWSNEMGDGASQLPITPNSSSYPPLLTQVRSNTFESGLMLDLECTNPSSNYVAAVTAVAGTINIFYRMVSGRPSPV